VQLTRIANSTIKCCAMSLCNSQEYQTVQKSVAQCPCATYKTFSNANITQTTEQSHTHTHTQILDMKTFYCVNVLTSCTLDFYIFYIAENTTTQFLKLITRIQTVHYNYKHKNNLYNMEHAPFSLLR